MMHDAGSARPAPRPRLQLSAGGRLNGGEQVGKVRRPIMSDAVDEETWRTVDAAAHAAHEVFTHPMGIEMFGELVGEAADIEPERARMGQKICLPELLLIGIERIVHG